MMILPSRGRPHLVQRFFDQGQPTLPGLLVIDDDDKENYRAVKIPPDWRVLVLPHLCLVDKCNAAFSEFPAEPWYGITNDDVLPETPQWDERLRAIAGPRNFAYGDDGINHRFSTAVMGGELVRAIGWFLCPALKHFYTDDAWELFHEIGLGIYVPDIKVTHLHFTVGKAPRDQTYAERGDPAKDQFRFETWKARDWPMLRDRVRAELRLH
jgi:hypothetical protein